MSEFSDKAQDLGGQINFNSMVGACTEVVVEIPRQEGPKLLKRIMDTVAWQ